MLPVEHDPLRDGDNAFLRLIESRKLCLDSIVGVRHRSWEKGARAVVFESGNARGDRRKVKLRRAGRALLQEGEELVGWERLKILRYVRLQRGAPGERIACPSSYSITAATTIVFR